MKRFLIIAVFGFAFLTAHRLPALTPKERATLNQVRTELAATKASEAQAKTALANAQQAAQKASQHAATTDLDNKLLSKQIDTEHKTSQTNAAAAAHYEEEHKLAHKFFGLGSFVLGFKILSTNLLILAAVVVVLMLILWGLSFANPAFAAALKFVMMILTAIFSFLVGLFKKKAP